MVFEEYGLKTGEVMLPGIELLVELSSNEFFKNCGAVNDIDSYTEKLVKIFNVKNYNVKNGKIKEGRHLGLFAGEERESLIYVKKSNFEPAELFCYGHESVHSIIFFGLEEYFLNMLRKMEFLLNPFEKYTDQESIANIGGWVSLYKKNLHNKVRRDPVLSPVFDDLIESKR